MAIATDLMLLCRTMEAQLKDKTQEVADEPLWESLERVKRYAAEIGGEVEQTSDRNEELATAVIDKMTESAIRIAYWQILVSHYASDSLEFQEDWQLHMT